MKTRYMILILAACGCLTLGGSMLYADETTVEAWCNDLKSDNEAVK